MIPQMSDVLKRDNIRLSYSCYGILKYGNSSKIVQQTKKRQNGLFE